MFDDARFKYETTMSLGRATGPSLLDAAETLLAADR